MNLFPINLNIENKICVIVGCGEVGERKAFDLLPYKAKIRIVSLKFTEKIIKNKNLFEIIESEYDKKYLNNAFLVFACTNNKDLNLKIYKDAKKIGALVNIVNVPEYCDFTVPAVVDRGFVKIAISTGGVSPALSRILKIKISEIVGEEYKKLANIMKIIREKQLKLNLDSNINKRKFYELLNSGIIEDLKKDDLNKVNEKIKKIFGFEITYIDNSL